VVEATAMQHWQQLWWMTGGSDGVGGGFDNGVSGILAMVG
jgi:hypothetical protein